MIVQLTGKLVYKSPTYTIIDVHGVGYGIKTSLHTFATLKNLETYTLLTHAYSKGDVHALYGFASQEEKHWFLQLINVNGVGPHTALTVLSSLNPSELAHVIAQNQVAVLKTVKGVGAKAAQRIVLELKDKLEQHIVESTTTPSESFTVDQEALSALTKLGLHPTAAVKALRSARQSHPENMDVEMLIKYALQVT